MWQKISWRETRLSRQGWKKAISWLVGADLKNSTRETRQRRGEGWMTVWQEGRREGNYAEAPAGPPPVSGTLLDKAPGLRTGGNTGVRLRSGWEIRKNTSLLTGPKLSLLPNGGRRTPHCAGAADSQRLTTPAAKRHYFMEGAASLCPRLSFPSEGPASVSSTSRVTAVALGWLADFSVMKVLSFIGSEYLQWNVYLGGGRKIKLILHVNMMSTLFLRICKTQNSQISFGIESYSLCIIYIIFLSDILSTT